MLGKERRSTKRAKTLLKATKETKEYTEFGAKKKAIKQNHSTQSVKRSKGTPQRKCK